MTAESYPTMISLGEDFKPALKYKPYLAIYTMVVVAVIWAVCLGWAVLIGEIGIPQPIVLAIVAVLVVCLLFVLLWTVLYYKSVVYHLNATEMTWKRGVWFRKTGIVPYNRITNVDIVQGPVMRMFGISNLKIQTAGYSGSNGSAEIAIEGIEEPEPLRAMIMDFVRGGAPSAAATGVDVSAAKASAASVSGDADIRALLAEVAAIRRLLEERK
ncbi:PH domain-containing protein [Methanocorpusculum vombati]|uniref:PH domain-containing protein n=1 Tax=Methanocorpusculum vombati TaxID=3002864 RepID=A0ABT4IKA2_9EURY|nr:PH domain-containing protein [Methanocorpusculum vombati]MCZ0862164.1 PH domain-containing protein [Methanocorpusculum vombati]MDE2519643.1 PH domain-containing protein [Methanocorpusculum sp.]MDE2545312.1 PH domain-containing protein [Methanocorpusculum sp.]